MFILKLFFFLAYIIVTPSLLQSFNTTYTLYVTPSLCHSSAVSLLSFVTHAIWFLCHSFVMPFFCMSLLYYGIYGMPPLCYSFNTVFMQLHRYATPSMRYLCHFIVMSHVRYVIPSLCNSCILVSLSLHCYVMPKVCYYCHSFVKSCFQYGIYVTPSLCNSIIMSPL